MQNETINHACDEISLFVIFWGFQQIKQVSKLRIIQIRISQCEYLHNKNTQIKNMNTKNKENTS